MKFQTIMTVDDLVSWNWENMMKSPGGKNSINQGRLLPAEGAMLPICVFYALGTGVSIMRRAIPIIAAVCILWYCLYPLLVKRRIRATMNQEIRMGKHSFLDMASTTELTDEEIIDVTQDVEKRVPYAQVHQILVTDEFITIGYSAKRCFILPVKCLEGRKDDVVNLLKEKCVAAVWADTGEPVHPDQSSASR